MQRRAAELTARAAVRQVTAILIKHPFRAQAVLEFLKNTFNLDVDSAPAQEPTSSWTAAIAAREEARKQRLVLVELMDMPGLPACSSQEVPQLVNGADERRVWRRLVGKVSN